MNLKECCAYALKQNPKSVVPLPVQDVYDLIIQLEQAREEVRALKVPVAAGLPPHRS